MPVQAEPEGYVRLFTEEGPPMASLLQQAARRRIAPAYVDEFLATAGHFPGPAPKSRA
jgi:LuxR family maltose regulon positive regulatory protein